MSRNFGNRTTISCSFSQLIFCCACAETAKFLLPVKFSTPNLKSPWAVSYLNTNFGGTSAKIYTCFERKTAFIMQNFHNLRAGGGWGDPFLTKPPKGTSLADFTRFESLYVQIRSGVFPLGLTTKKRDTTKSHREVIFHLFAGNSPLTQI